MPDELIGLLALIVAVLCVTVLRAWPTEALAAICVGAATGGAVVVYLNTMQPVVTVAMSDKGDTDPETYLRGEFEAGRMDLATFESRIAEVMDS